MTPEEILFGRKDDVTGIRLTAVSRLTGKSVPTVVRWKHDCGIMRLSDFRTVAKAVSLTDEEILAIIKGDGTWED